MKSTTSVPSKRRKPGTWRKVIPYAIGGFVLLAIMNGLRPKPVHVETAIVTRGPLTVTVFEEGKTRIRHRYVITPPVAGFLNRVALRPGALIQAGKTVLATIEPQMSGFLDPRARAQAEAALNAAEATKMSRKANLERAASALDLAKKDFTRAESLRQTGAISAQDFDSAENKVEMLTREFRAAEFALRVADFEVAQAQAALVQATQPEESHPISILAPVDGFVLNVFEENSRVVTVSTQIMEVGDPRDLEAEIELLSSDAVGVTPGAAVSIEQWGGNQPLHGRVSIVEPGGYTKISALGVEEQRVKVRVDFTDSTGRLGDRYRVEARIVTWHGDDVLQVPTGALFRHGDDWMAFIMSGGRARLQKVEIGHTNGLAAEVVSGLTKDDRVIIHPPDRLSNGNRVK